LTDFTSEKPAIAASYSTTNDSSNPSESEKALSRKISTAVLIIKRATTIAVKLSNQPIPNDAAKIAIAVPILVHASLRLSLAAASRAELFTRADNRWFF